MLLGAITIAFGVGLERIPVIVGGLAVMGVGLGTSSASIQAAALEAVPLVRAGSAAGVFSTSRYLGSVVGSTVLAAAFAQRSGNADHSRFVYLFAGLSSVAAGAMVVNALVADRRSCGMVLTSIA